MALVLREFQTQPRCEGREFLDTLGCMVAVVRDEDDEIMISRRLERVCEWLAGVGQLADPKARDRVEYHERKLVLMLTAYDLGPGA